MKDGAGPRLRGMTLTVTERCNLRCGYCYVPVERGRTMTSEVIDAAVDLFVRHAADVPEVSLSFFGGEPFLEVPLMRQAIGLAQERFAGARKVRVATPTNGTLIEGRRLEFCREHGIELAVSLDGEPAGGDRRFPDGRECAGRILSLLPEILTLDGSSRVTARMTVTPSNVDRLASNVAALAAMGLRRIFFLPAYEIATWLAGIHGAGRKPPDLPTWRGVESRLVKGRPRRACGAGDRFVAVGADGAVFPCYRFLFAADNGEWRLGHVFEGFTNRSALAALKMLDPSLARPEDGDCSACPARDGCTFFCPALGHWMLRDPLAVPAVACRLERARVEAIRPSSAARHRLRRKRPAGRRWATAAALAAAVAGGGVLASCSEQTSRRDGGDAIGDAPDAAAEDMTTDAIMDDIPVGGLCPDVPVGDAEVVSDPDVVEDEVPVGGLCPVWVDEDSDAVEDAGTDEEELPGPGLCPTPGLC
jgi:uncharacterized protein